MAQGTTKGVPIDTDPLLAANSDLLVPSEKAVRTYIAANSVAFSSLFANPPLSYNGAGVFSIAQATVSTSGYLSSTDWGIFYNKQAAGNYITALTGEVTASGPGSVAATIANNAITYAKMQAVSATSKLLGSSSTTTPVQEITIGTGLSLSGTTLSATGTGGTITALTGDVTASGSGSVVATIANDAVTYDKTADEGKLAMIGMLRFISGN